MEHRASSMSGDRGGVGGVAKILLAMLNLEQSTCTVTSITVGL